MRGARMQQAPPQKRPTLWWEKWEGHVTQYLATPHNQHLARRCTQMTSVVTRWSTCMPGRTS